VFLKQKSKLFNILK